MPNNPDLIGVDRLADTQSDFLGNGPSECQDKMLLDVQGGPLSETQGEAVAEMPLLLTEESPLDGLGAPDAPEVPDFLEKRATLAEERALILPVHGTTVAAEDLRVRMVLASDFDQMMEIDASAVESVGQAVLQLLVAAKIEADARGQAFTLRNPSQAFVDRVAACGLAAAIGLPVEEEIQP